MTRTATPPQTYVIRDTTSKNYYSWSNVNIVDMSRFKRKAERFASHAAAAVMVLSLESEVGGSYAIIEA